MAVLRRCRPYAAYCGVVFALLFSAPLAGQTVQGRVLEEGSGRGIPGAAVFFLDEDGRQQQAMLTFEDGGFRFTVTSPASYRLRAEMIGRETIQSGAFVVGPEHGSVHDLVLPALPIRLAGLEVRGTERCGGDLESAHSVYLVWTEVEKVLRATQLTLSANVHRFRLAEYDRRRRKGSMAVVQESVNESEVVGGHEPFVSLNPDSLADGGYIREEDGQTWIYGPGTAVLLSRAFQDTHCFALRRDGSRPGMIGVSFDPVPNRSTSDIRGLLWLDEESAELRTLEFEFENVPRSLMRGEYEGTAEFRRLEEGGWIIERWWLRSPDPENLLQIRERAGEVLEIGPVPKP